MTSLGAMRASIAGLASEIGWSEKAFRNALSEISGEAMVGVDEKASFLAIRNFLRYNKPESPNVIRSWGAALDLLPECPSKNRLIAHVLEHVKALPEAFGKSMPNQEPEQEPEQGSKEESSQAKPCSDVALELAAHLRARILQRKLDSKVPDNGHLARWAKDIDLMLRVDQREPDVVRRVIDWCQTKGSFWSTNILSGESLREKFDRLEEQMKNGGSRGDNARYIDPNHKQPGLGSRGGNAPLKSKYDSVPVTEVEV